MTNAGTKIESAYAFDHFVGMAAQEAIQEARRGFEKHGGINSLHEGYAVLLEEVDEFWHEVKNDNYRAQAKRMAEAFGIGYTNDPTEIECIQIAAVALRLAVIVKRSRMRQATAKDGAGDCVTLSEEPIANDQ